MVRYQTGVKGNRKGMRRVTGVETMSAGSIVWWDGRCYRAPHNPKANCQEDARDQQDCSREVGPYAGEWTPGWHLQLQRDAGGPSGAIHRVHVNEAGDFTAGEIPVPIPNTEVKLRRADCTARESVWESRSSPT